MSCNKSNPCQGVYGKCLDVKITNVCNGTCKFCIEKDGINPAETDVKELIQATNLLNDYQKVLILGGEPFLYPHLVGYIEGIKDKEEIYITTNGSAFTEEVIRKIAPYVTAINISIMHFDTDINKSLMGIATNNFLLFDYIRLFKSYGVKVRLNCNLMQGGIDTSYKQKQMMMYAKQLGVDTVRFAELQNCPELFVAAKTIFCAINDNPYCQGCEQDLGEVDGVAMKVRLTCGLVNPVKVKPDIIDKNNSLTKVMYPSATVSDGWISQREESIIPSNDCHSSRRESRESSTSRGCH